MYSNRPRIRILSIRPKMSQQQQQQVMRAPKQEMAVSGGSNRRYPAQKPQNGMNSARNGKSASPTVTIEEVPNHTYLESINNQTGSNAKFDEEKLPVFLIKLWNIVEDTNLQSIVHWDETGASFHISDPYSFCRNVLPHFFKHNNLNSLIRQLNMYGFRKMTPLNQGGLTRTESDQDHLEFSHPCFIQNRPELLSQIKRKQSTKVTEEKQVTEQTQQNLEVVMAEMRSMREKARNMENKMNALTKENRDIWDQMSAMRQQHARQQQYFKKLLHFLVSVMQPGISKRVAKRLAIGTDFHDSPGASTSKRPRTGDEGPYKDVCELLESLQREAQEPAFRRFSSGNSDCGPLISEVTDEFGNSPGGGRSDMFSDAFAGMPRYSDHSRDSSPHPHISQPSSSSGMAQGARDEYKFDAGSLFKEQPEEQPTPATMYMGSGALTHENVLRSVPATKRDFQGVPTSSRAPQAVKGQNQPIPSQQAPRMAYKLAKPQQAPSQQPNSQQQSGQSYNNYSTVIPPQITYQPNQPTAATGKPPPGSNNQQLAICDEDPRLGSVSPINLSPSFDRHLSQEIQNYFIGYDQELDNFRGMMHSQNWEDANWDTFGDNLPEDDDVDGGQQHQLALEDAPETSHFGAGYEENDGTDLLEPLLNDSRNPENGFEVPDPNYMPLADEEIFPRSPVLRTPSPSNII